MKLRIADNLHLPAEDLLESAIGVIGKRGRGKTGMVKVFMEELVASNLPFIALDPVGVMWGIRSSIDGKGPGLPVLIVGGSHGDVRLDRRAGAQIARAVVQANISCIIDFSEESKAAYREFVKDFAHTLFSINDTPRMVIIEEAPELVPQRMRPDMTGVFEAVERLVSRGRNKGIGVTLVSQRAATINKDVLTQIDALFVFGLTSPQDRKALVEWVQAKDDEGHLREFESGIAGLQKQEAWFWSPEAFAGQFTKVRIRDFKTFHPDKTHLRRTGLLTSKPVTTDISDTIKKLGGELDRLAKEKVSTASIPKLESKIKQLEHELEKAKAHPQTATLSEGARKAFTQAQDALKQENAALRAGLKKASSISRRVQKAIEILSGVANPGPVDIPTPPQVTRQAQPMVYTPAPTRRISEQPTSSDDAPMRSGERRVLETIATRYPLTLTRTQLGTLSGFTPSGGTFNTYFGDLKRRGFVTEDSSKNVVVTQEGMDYVGEVPKSPRTHEEIMAMWRRNLRAGEMRILEVLVDAYPECLSREELANSSEFTFTGGTFITYLGILKRNALITISGQEIRATEVLFPD